MEDQNAYLPEPGTNGLPYQFHCPLEPVPERDTSTVEKIMRHQQKNGRLQPRCRSKGYGRDQDTWKYAEKFVQGVQSDWLEYNRRNWFSVQVQDLKVQ